MMHCICEDIVLNRPSRYDGYAPAEIMAFHPHCPIEAHREAVDDEIVAQTYGLVEGECGEWIG